MKNVKLYKSLIFLVDGILMNLCFILALVLKFEASIPSQYARTYITHWFTFTLIQLLVYLTFNMYKSLWRYASIKELMQLFGAVSVGTLSILAYDSILALNFPLSVYVIYFALILLAMGGARISYRILAKLAYQLKLILEGVKNEKDGEKKGGNRILLVGAGDAASLVIQEMYKDVSNKNTIVIAVDDATYKVGSVLHGVPVKGTTKLIPTLADAYDIDEIIVAMPSVSKKRISKILELCNQTDCNLKIFPGVNKSIRLPFSLQHLRPVNIEDLLGRDEIMLDNTSLAGHINNKTILVTGGGGSIGSELCRQIASFSPSKLVIFDIYENNAYDIQNELLRSGISPNKLDVLIGSVRDNEKLREVFRTYHPDIVFHAAAHKHVPLMETSPAEAVKNNVFGTLNTALLAREFRVSKFILISTDKAVNPTNVMGATKRICEMIIQSLSPISNYTEFAAVRFGNVLGSNGSVVPLFKKQLEAGGPLTVTHPDIIRYFMTIPEAVRLILQAMTFAKGGEIFVLDMGEPVKILDLAKSFIKLSGLEENKDIQIEFTGLRPGEKLYEELLMSEEGLGVTNCDKIFVGQPLELTYSDLKVKLDMLRTCLQDDVKLRNYLEIIVPTYHPAEQVKTSKQLVSTNKAKEKDYVEAVS